MGSSGHRLKRREISEVLGGRERDIVFGEKRFKVVDPGLEVIQIATPEVSISNSRNNVHKTIDRTDGTRDGPKPGFGQPLTFSGTSPR